MLINFDEINTAEISGLNGGTGTVYAQMILCGRQRIILSRIPPGSSIGAHLQKSGDDINYIISGEGKAVCGGAEEELKAGVCHICPQGTEHSIVNTGEDDLVMFTVVAAGTQTGEAQ